MTTPSNTVPPLPGTAPSASPTERPPSQGPSDSSQEMELRGELGEGGETHQVTTDPEHRLTTQQGVPVADDQNTLRVGERGPSALEDFHFREKIFHFDH